MREIIRRVDPPLIPGPIMRRLILRNAIRRKIPHLRVPVFEILPHAKEGGLGLVFAVAHVAELGKVRFDVLVGMGASVPGALLAVFSASLEFDFGFFAVADIGLFQFDEFLR